MKLLRGVQASLARVRQIVAIAAMGMAGATGPARATEAPSTPTAPTSPVYVIDLFDAVPADATQAALLLTGYAATARSSLGCLRAELLRQAPPTGNHFALVTVWRGPADVERYIVSATARSFRDHFQPLAASPVDERRYAGVVP